MKCTSMYDYAVTIIANNSVYGHSYKEVHMMKNTTNATNNQQVIGKNLQTVDKETFIPENDPLKRPDRRRLKRAAEKEAKKAQKAKEKKPKKPKVPDNTPPLPKKPVILTFVMAGSFLVLVLVGTA